MTRTGTPRAHTGHCHEHAARAAALLEALALLRRRAVLRPSGDDLPAMPLMAPEATSPAGDRGPGGCTVTRWLADTAGSIAECTKRAPVTPRTATAATAAAAAIRRRILTIFPCRTTARDGHRQRYRDHADPAGPADGRLRPAPSAARCHSNQASERVTYSLGPRLGPASSEKWAPASGPRTARR